MSYGFKRVLAFISLIVVVPVSVWSSFVARIGDVDLGICYTTIYQTTVCNFDRFYFLFGLLTLVFYVLFVIKKKDIYFWLTVIPFFIFLTWLIIYAISN
jgi:hypothetical protein